MENLNFNEMNLSEEILKAVADMGFETATPIQAQSISSILAGKDVLGQSQTGTGKTAAFAIPCIEKIDEESQALQALVLCPTRELAMQVSEEFRKLLKYKQGVKVLPIYGGQAIEKQILMLKKGVQIVIGTPGRVIDHINRRTLKMQNVNMVVLDEADEMLDMGFREDIETILSRVLDDRQTVLFSATIPKAILELTRKYQNNPVEIRVKKKELTVNTIEQIYFQIREINKIEALCRLIDAKDPELGLIFCNTKRKVDELVEKLQSRGYFAEALHGDLKQHQRDMVMKKFRSHTLQIMVATDVAARGIDVDDIDVVINYDIPLDYEQYVHRIGRTGRAGKSGTAYTFVTNREMFKLREIMSYTKANIALGSLPSVKDVEDNRIKAYVEQIKETMESPNLAKYMKIVKKIVETEEITSLDIAAALLTMQLYNENEVDIDFEKDKFRDFRDKEERKTSKFSRDKSKSSKDEKMVRVFMNIGEKQKIRKKDIVGALANEVKIPTKEIGPIDIYDNFTFVNISEKYAKQALSKMKFVKIKGNSIDVELAKKAKR
ncbi:MAG: DEAD/DEAH box helicase [Defluviitaleaceae bacterium]|nr:DEAD/DEAH box helicase [Defluviitaleaceae bacterium]